ADYTGAPLSSAATQTIIPIDVTPSTVPNNGPAISLARTSVTLTWQTSEAATGGAQYGYGTSASMIFIPDDGVYPSSHTVTIMGLVPNTTYSVIVTGHDPAGNLYSAVRKQFTTLR